MANEIEEKMEATRVDWARDNLLVNLRWLSKLIEEYIQRLEAGSTAVGGYEMAGASVGQLEKKHRELSGAYWLKQDRKSAGA